MRLFIAPLILVYVFFPAFLLAQDAKLIAEGKKEGKVVIYGSMETDIFEGIQKAFKKRTGIGVDYWRAAGATVLERASKASIPLSRMRKRSRSPESASPMQSRGPRSARSIE